MTRQDSIIGPKPLRRPAASQRGAALLYVLILSSVLGLALASVLGYVLVSARLEGRSNARMKALYAAEFALERNFALMSRWLADNRPDIPTIGDTTALANLTTAPVDVFPEAQGYTFTANVVTPIEAGVAVDEHGGVSQSTYTYRFLNAAEVAVTPPGGGAPVSVALQEEIVYGLTPPFTCAILYDSPMRNENDGLELFPGANFVVKGRVHANGRFYHGSNASLTFRSAVTSTAGSRLGYYHPDDPRGDTTGTNVTYTGGAPFVTSPENPPVEIQSGSNPNTQGGRELIEIPNTSASDPNESTRMYTSAGLKVLANSRSTALTTVNDVAIPANGKVFMTRDETVIPTSDPLYAVINSAFSSGTMKDFRENYAGGGASVKTVDVNVGQLRTLVSNGGLPERIPNQETWPATGVPSSLAGQPIPAALRGKALWNGEVYVADPSNTPTSRTGVRLTNGASLPAGGMTVATENAAYIVGNYNTGGNPPVNSSSNLDAANTVTGYGESAAVLADAVTIVSARWTSSNYNAVTVLANRDPVATTVNTAIVAGNVPTTSAAYSGGAENFPRFLEDWSNVRMTYYGSMVIAFPSQQSDSVWRNTGDYYNAPTRNWYFDINFLNPNRMPRGFRREDGRDYWSLRRGQWTEVSRP